MPNVATHLGVRCYGRISRAFRQYDLAMSCMHKEAALCVLCGPMNRYGEFWSDGEVKHTGFVCRVCRDNLELNLLKLIPGVMSLAARRGTAKPRRGRKTRRMACLMVDVEAQGPSDGAVGVSEVWLSYGARGNV